MTLTKAAVWSESILIVIVLSSIEERSVSDGLQCELLLWNINFNTK